MKADQMLEPLSNESNRGSNFLFYSALKVDWGAAVIDASMVMFKEDIAYFIKFPRCVLHTPRNANKGDVRTEGFHR